MNRTLELESDLFVDRFSDDERNGHVIGSRADSGVRRRGTDVEGVLAIDGGALRIQPLTRPGWGRSGFAYGPYRREPGLTFAVALLNGHNTSQAENLPEGLQERLKRWLYGSASRLGPMVGVRRSLEWLRSPHKRHIFRRFRGWIESAPRVRTVPKLDENLALGWFPSEVPEDPCAEGNAFVMHALAGRNGELWTTVQSEMLPAISGVQNLPLYLVVVLRADGAAYYAASLPNANGFSAFPILRPLAIDTSAAEPVVFAGVHQSVLGQIGFRVDTRVYAAQVLREPLAAANWFGTAHAADRFVGVGRLGDTAAEIGGVWGCSESSLERGAQGARFSETTARGVTCTALLAPSTPSGLIHAVFERLDAKPGEKFDSDAATFGLAFRAVDQDNFWCVETDGSSCWVSLVEDGRHERIASSSTLGDVGSTMTLQVIDDGSLVAAFLNGRAAFDAPVRDTRFADATGVGLRARAGQPGAVVRAFEAHPRAISAPRGLSLPSPWNPSGTQIVAQDDFHGPASDLHGRRTPIGNKLWERVIGSGRYDLTGSGAVRVRASVEHPNPGRTAYLISWERADLADLEVEITPPGTARGQRQAGRCGLVFWQDPKNYITVTTYLDDGYVGASVSSFFQIGGYEELYDAVWTMVADRIIWGRPFRFRMVFDGMRYLAYVDDEPVLYRALSDVYSDLRPLSIRKVGLVTNWEWGDDTGSLLRNFRAKG
jgi:hypothetical protein